MTHQETANWINGNLDDESAKVLMMFIDYLYENEFAFDGENISYRGCGVGLIHIYAKDDWWIYLNHDVFEHEKFPFDEEMTEFMRSQAKLHTWCSSNCKKCNKNSETPEQYMFFGKTYDNICKNCRLSFGRFNTEEVKTIDPELCFTVERMKKALKAMHVCKQIIEYKQRTE